MLSMIAVSCVFLKMTFNYMKKYRVFEQPKLPSDKQESKLAKADTKTKNKVDKSP